MQNIIYKSGNIIPWDTQSAFKMTSYNTTVEENMVFCYLKAYVHHSDLVMCNYCFVENPVGDNNIHLYINLNPEDKDNLLEIKFGYDGMGSVLLAGKEVADKQGIKYRCFKTDDEQGFYWCGEIVLEEGFIRESSGIKLEERSIFTMNMVQQFENGDFSVLCGDATATGYNPAESMDVFAVLDY